MPSTFLDITGLSHFLDKLRLLIVQSDWAQTDNEEMDFIKNKPTISVDEQTLVLDGWLDPAVPITVTQSDPNDCPQTISVSSTSSDFDFDVSTNTGWVGKSEPVTVSITSPQGYIPGKIIINNVVQETAPVTISVTTDSLEISAESGAESVGISCGSYAGGVGYYQGGYGNILGNPYWRLPSGMFITFTQITAQLVNGQYTLAVRAINTNTNEEITSFTLLNAQGEDILNTPTLQESVARDMMNNYYSGRQVVFYVKEVL